MTILDTNKGLLKVDSPKNVVGNETDRLFNGMIVEESLLDPSIMNEIPIDRVQITSPGRWHIYSVVFSEHQIEHCQRWIKDDPWYIHFWRDDEIIVIFKDKIFRFSQSDKATWKPALTHGQALGIPEAQLDFLTR